MTTQLADIQIRDRDAHLHPFTSVPELLEDGPTVIVRGDGCVLEDAEGNLLYDASAGLWCVNVGHGRREVIDAIRAQLDKLAFFHSFNGMSNEPIALLSRRILDIAPPNMRRVFFGNSGSDAVDSAVKLIWFYNNLRGYDKKKKIIARTRGYHGSTMVAASLSGLPSVHRLFDLPLSFVRHVSCPDTYRFPGRDADYYAEELDALIRAEGPDTVAAFFAEPVMGTGGVVVPPRGYYDAVVEVLRRHDVLLVSDEVITGFGRLGSWFGLEQFGYSPDIITCAKGLTSNYIPMSAVIIGSRVWDEIDSKRQTVGVFSHGFTTSAHPVAAAAGLATLKVIETEGLLDRTKSMGRLLLTRLRDRLSEHETVGDIRGSGLMVGLELVADKKTKRSFDPSVRAARLLQRAALRNGVLVRALPVNDVVALSPPLIIDEHALEEIVGRLAVAVEETIPMLRGR
jgi:L-2,4-diaminobutyrate transaminase